MSKYCFLYFCWPLISVIFIFQGWLGEWYHKNILYHIIFQIKITIFFHVQIWFSLYLLTPDLCNLYLPRVIVFIVQEQILLIFASLFSHSLLEKFVELSARRSYQFITFFWLTFYTFCCIFCFHYVELIWDDRA